jgi:histidinol-phosphate phosphatase family protein
LNLKTLHINTSWTVFLDRDGVINKLLENDYVKHPSEFEFLPGVLQALQMITKKVGHIFIVTNQQGIGKNIMTEDDLMLVHQFMLSEITKNKGKIDHVYFSPFLASENHPFRKPNIGMALQAKEDYPTIQFQQSIMIGDAISDMEFGKKAGMKTVFIGNKKDKNLIDFNFQSLKHFAEEL